MTQYLDIDQLQRYPQGTNAIEQTQRKNGKVSRFRDFAPQGPLGNYLAKRSKWSTCTYTSSLL